MKSRSKKIMYLVTIANDLREIEGADSFRKGVGRVGPGQPMMIAKERLVERQFGES